MRFFNEEYREMPMSRLLYILSGLPTDTYLTRFSHVRLDFAHVYCEWITARSPIFIFFLRNNEFEKMCDLYFIANNKSFSYYLSGFTYYRGGARALIVSMFASLGHERSGTLTCVRDNERPLATHIASVLPHSSQNYQFVMLQLFSEVQY